MDPGAPVDLNKAAEIYGIASDGVGGDAGGDGGAAGGAGDGSPLRRVRVTLTDAKGQQVAGTTDANGKFLLMYKTAEFVPPLVLRTFDAEGNVLASTTDEATPSGKAIRASINPLTDKITSDALAGVEGTDRPFDGSKIDPNKLKAAKSDLVNSVKDALGVVGADSSTFDPVKSVYNYDGTGVDAVIDSISHSRYPATGATQLRAKLDPLGADVNGNVAPTFITADRPLKTDSVAVASSQALTFAKINAWINEMNRCLALSSAARAADADCVDADGSRLVSPNYKHNGKDVAESYRRLFSETDRSAVQGSALSNPSILFNAPPEGAQDYESAVVQFTVDQPRSGPRDVFERPRTLGSEDGADYPLRYTITTVFRRNDGLTRAKAGNWILHGNQANYDFNVQPSYWRGRQVNPSQQQGRFRSGFSSALEIMASPQKFDMTNKTFVSANIRAVRVRGPGLPSAGLVLSTPTSISMLGRVSQDTGPTSLSPDNRRGEILSGPMSTLNWGRNFFLDSINLDGGQPGNYDFWMGTGEEAAEPGLTDFSALQAYSRYSFEVFLNSNTDTSKADEVQFVRIMAPVMPPAFSADLQRNTVSSTAYLTPPEPVPSRLCAASVGWADNPNATQIDTMYMAGGGFGAQPLGGKVLFRGPAEVARLDGQRSTGAVVGSCNWQVNMPSLQVENNFRVVAAGATEKRSRIWDLAAWTSDPPAPAPSPTP